MNKFKGLFVCVLALFCFVANSAERTEPANQITQEDVFVRGAQIREQKKLICFDLDGTLSEQRTPVEDIVLELLDSLGKHYHLAMITGGNSPRVYRQMKNYPITILGNYGMQESVVENGEFKIIRDDSFKADTAFFLEKCQYIREKYGYTKYYGEPLEFHPSGMVTFSLVGTGAPIEVKLPFDPDKAKRRAIYPEMLEIFKDYSVFIGGTTSFDITPKQYNKYDAAVKYAASLGLTPDQVLFVGDDLDDGGNDSHVRIFGMDYIRIDNYKKTPERLAFLLEGNDKIRTPWADKVTPRNAHREYPRPQMIRKAWKSLNGLWKYAVSGKDESSMPKAQGDILVPFAYESQLSGVGGRLTADDALWYRKTFRVPCRWRRHKDVILHFGAVDYACEIWVNGKPAGMHKGGYTSFELNITPYLKWGRQRVELKVLDGTDNKLQPRGKQTLRPWAGGIWYTAVSGIWQSVWMEAVPRKGHITDYNVVADIAAGTISVTPEAEVQGESEILVELIEGGIGYSAENPGTNVLASASVVPGKAAILKPSSLKLWSPDEPYLYGLRITLLKDGKAIDNVDAYTAAREISMVTDADGHKRMALNGDALFQIGPLDQGWWPDGLYTAPCDEALRYDLERTKEYGFNMIRKHVKVEPDRWYTHCDQLGILVWQDMPCVDLCNPRTEWAQGIDKYDAGFSDQLSAEARENFVSEWSDVVLQHKKFPCIVVWVPFNEGWGQFNTKGVVDMTKELDPTRLVNMASGGNWISGGIGEILDSHHYPNPKMRIWDPEMVNVLGEFGGIGLPVAGHTWQQSRFSGWGYVKMSSVEESTVKYEEYLQELLPIIKDGCSAAVYTQTTDVERELNGLMTYDRKVDKLIPERVAAANRKAIEAY